MLRTGAVPRRCRRTAPTGRPPPAQPGPAQQQLQPRASAWLHAGNASRLFLILVFDRLLLVFIFDSVESLDTKHCPTVSKEQRGSYQKSEYLQHPYQRIIFKKGLANCRTDENNHDADDQSSEVPELYPIVFVIALIRFYL